MMKRALIVLLVLFSVQCFAQTLTTDTAVVQHTLSPKERKDIFLHESRPGGQLDFFTKIKGHENDRTKTQSGTVTTKLGEALMEWSRLGFNLGIAKVKDVLDTWKTLKERPATRQEKEYIIRGFKK